jgi:hypothetical protein
MLQPRGHHSLALPAAVAFGAPDRGWVLVAVLVLSGGYGCWRGQRFIRRVLLLLDDTERRDLRLDPRPATSSGWPSEQASVIDHDVVSDREAV